MPEEELSQVRTAGVPELKYRHGAAEFFILFSTAGVEDLQAGALRKVYYAMPFPDQGPEKIARRGILSRSQYTTPNCSLTFLLPGNRTK
jgi:hypothetical protein